MLIPSISSSVQFTHRHNSIISHIIACSLLTGAPPIGWNLANFGTMHPPPPLPPRNSSGSSPTTAVERTARVLTKLYENVVLRKAYDPELMAFYHMVLNVRKEFEYTDERTNQGHVVAQQFDCPYISTPSIKLMVHPALEAYTVDCARFAQAQAVCSAADGGAQMPGYGPPIVFTCDIDRSVEFVISHVLCTLERQIRGNNASDFALKQIGRAEWLAPEAKLSHLECIHNCVKLEKDIQLALYPRSTKLLNTIGRTKQVRFLIRLALHSYAFISFSHSVFSNFSNSFYEHYSS